MQTYKLFENLWRDYAGLNPSVQKVHDLFEEQGEEIVNDHIAFRTFDDPRVNIDILAQPFLDAGYQEKGEYTFEAKKLFAKHYEHITKSEAPRIFISQLKTKEFSEFLQKTVKDILDQVPAEKLAEPDLLYAGRLWETPSYEVYEKLRKESEYAAWLYVYGFRANHFTVSVNHLKKFDSVEEVNSFLKQKGFLINDSGGEVKGTPEELLEQSSIKSESIPVQFQEGEYEIPGCYYEFAKRYPDKSGKIYSGFIAKSADKIFESTDYYRKNKKA